MMNPINDPVIARNACVTSGRRKITRGTRGTLPSDPAGLLLFLKLGYVFRAE